MSFLRPASVLIASFIALFAMFAACIGESTVAPNESVSSSFGRSQGVGGPKAPSFSVSTGGSSNFSLDEHSGEVVILYFSFPG